MLSILIAGGISLFVTLVGTPFFIKILVARQYGQFIRQDGPTSHQIKRGTPTMGGVMIIVGTLLGYFVANLATGRSPNASGLLLLYLTVGLGFIGFLDDFAKIRKKQSLGLTPWAKIIGQAFVGISFAVMALRFRNSENRTPATLRISILRDTNIDLAFAGAGVGLVLFVLCPPGAAIAAGLPLIFLRNNDPWKRRPLIALAIGILLWAASAAVGVIPFGSMFVALGHALRGTPNWPLALFIWLIGSIWYSAPGLVIGGLLALGRGAGIDLSQEKFLQAPRTGLRSLERSKQAARDELATADIQDATE